MSNFVCRICFWNNLHQIMKYAHNQKIGKLNNLNVFVASKVRV